MNDLPDCWTLIICLLIIAFTILATLLILWAAGVFAYHTTCSVNC